MKSEERKDYERRWRQANKGRVLQCAREWRSRNVEKLRAKSRAWYAVNREKKAEYHKKHHEKNKAKLNSYYRKRKAEARQLALSHYGVQGRAVCHRCGIDDIDVLTLDHMDDSGAKHRRTDKAARAIVFWVIRNGLPEGFQTLCLNCNYKKHLKKVREQVAQRYGDRSRVSSCVTSLEGASNVAQKSHHAAHPKAKAKHKEHDVPEADEPEVEESVKIVGTVKSISGNCLVVTLDDGSERECEVPKGCIVCLKKGSEGFKPAQLSEVSGGDSVEYCECPPSLEAIRPQG